MSDATTEAKAPATATCPKCGRKRPADADACPRCGLEFARWKPEERPAPTNLDDRGVELWQQIQGNWSDADRHEEFLRHCLQTGTLAAAGRLYRARLDDDPKDTVAAKMQAQILTKATLSLSLHKSQAPTVVTRSRWFWLVVLAAMTLGIAGGLFWRRFR